MQTVFEYQKEGQRGDIDTYVLMSTSPRRQELLRFLNPEVKTVAVDERSIQQQYMDSYKQDDFLTRAAKTCCEISKAKSDLPIDKGVLAISADTIVVLGDAIYNKPVDLNEAKHMLHSYLGRSQHVVTSVCLRTTDSLEVFYTVARIDFVDYYPALDAIIDTYVETKSPLDKSGAYGIQELDPRLVRGIFGDIHTIIGLPVSEIAYRLWGQ